MTKKKVSTSKQASSKTTRAKAAAAAGPVTPAEVARPPFKRPQSLNFAGVGRNDICPCGSGKRFKNCHGS